MTSPVINSTRTTSELLTTALQRTVTTDAEDVFQTFDVNKSMCVNCRILHSRPILSYSYRIYVGVRV